MPSKPRSYAAEGNGDDTMHGGATYIEKWKDSYEVDANVGLTVVVAPPARAFHSESWLEKSSASTGSEIYINGRAVVGLLKQVL
jgi:hypothetical protein